MNDERAKFEVHAGNRALRLDRDDGESYRYIQTDEAWEAWQARASQSDGTSGDDAAVRVAAIEEVVSIFEYWLGDEPTDSYQARCLAAIRALAAPNQGENHVG